MFVMHREVGMDTWTEEEDRTHTLPPLPRCVDNQLIICGLSAK